MINEDHIQQPLVIINTKWQKADPGMVEVGCSKQIGIIAAGKNLPHDIEF